MVNRETDPIPNLPVTFFSEKDNPFINHGVASRGHNSPILPSADKVAVKMYFWEIAPKLIGELDKKLQLKKRGSLLDVGKADEMPIVTALEKKGIRVHGISMTNSSASHSPISKGGNSSDYEGDIALALDTASVIRDKKFGTVLFWGAWDTTGAGDHNEMIGNMIYKRARNADSAIPLDQIRDMVSQEKDNIFQVCSTLLQQDGLLGIVSARYSFWGGGFSVSDYDHEMISFIDVIRRGFETGAQNVYIFGRTRDEFKKELISMGESIHDFLRKFHLPPVEALQARMDMPIQFPHDLRIEDSFLTPDDISNAKSIWNKIQAKGNIGYIDAVFLEYK